MYENESAIIELMFQASILESFLQKRGPSLRIPAVFHSKQMVAAAIWTHTSLIEDFFGSPSVWHLPTGQVRPLPVCLCKQPSCTLQRCWFVFATYYPASKHCGHPASCSVIGKGLPKFCQFFHSFRGGGKENSRCSVTPVVTHNHWPRLEFHIWEWFYFKPLLQCKTERGHIAGILKSRLNKGVQVHRGNCI